MSSLTITFSTPRCSLKPHQIHNAMKKYELNSLTVTILIGCFGALICSIQSCKGNDEIHSDMKPGSKCTTEGLPKIDHPDNQLDPLEFQEHSFSYSFDMKDCYESCDFEFMASLPEPVPEWTRWFIAMLIRGDIMGMLSHRDDVAPHVELKDYYDLNDMTPKTDSIDAKDKTPEQIASHYAKEFERIARSEYEGSEQRNPECDLSFKMIPVWQSKCRQYITYRFNVNTIDMGLHYHTDDYYLTFNSDTGQLLGFDQIFDSRKMNNVIRLLETEFRIRKNEFENKNELGNFDNNELKWEIYSASCGTNLKRRSILKERYGMGVYPRPAVTDSGIVFSYQSFDLDFTCHPLHIILSDNQTRRALHKQFKLEQ